MEIDNNKIPGSNSLSVNTEFVLIQAFMGKHRNWIIWSDLSEVDAM